MFPASGNMHLYCLEGDNSTASREVFYWLYTYVWNTNYRNFREKTQLRDQAEEYPRVHFTLQNSWYKFIWFSL